MAVACGLAIGAVVHSSSEAASIDGVEFSPFYQTKTLTLRLTGAALKKYFSIKVFAAGLYLGEEVPSKQVLADVPKRLEVVYFQNIPQVELARTTRKAMAANIPPREFQSLEKRIDQLNSYYVDVKPGDRYTATYIPRLGTKIALNGQLQGVIRGADFAVAFFATWVGDRPVDETLKAELLGE